jgi:hypothetical protein
MKGAFKPVTEDGFFVPEDQESPMDIRIELIQPWYNVVFEGIHVTLRLHIRI